MLLLFSIRITKVLGILAEKYQVQGIDRGAVSVQKNLIITVMNVNTTIEKGLFVYAECHGNDASCDLLSYPTIRLHKAEHINNTSHKTTQSFIPLKTLVKASTLMNTPVIKIIWYSFAQSYLFNQGQYEPIPFSSRKRTLLLNTRVQFLTIANMSSSRYLFQIEQAFQLLGAFRKNPRCVWWDINADCK